MAHPFTKLLEKALDKSTELDNRVLTVAEQIRAKGYREEELLEVLHAMRFGRIDPTEEAIITEAIEEFSDEAEDEGDEDDEDEDDEAE